MKDEAAAAVLRTDSRLLAAAKLLLQDAMDRDECYDEETGEMFDDWKELSAAIDEAEGKEGPK